MTPQGMTSFPTMYQHYVGKVLEPAGQAFPHACIIYYMDDILLVASKEELQSIYFMTQDMLHKNDLIIIPDKVQRSDSVQYLRQLVIRTNVKPHTKKCPLDNLKTLKNNLQTLLGITNWLHSALRIPKH